MSPNNDRQNDLHDPLVLLQRIHRWRTAFFGLIILIAGAAIGASGMFMWDRHKLIKKQPPRRTTQQQVATKPPPSIMNTPWGRLSVSLQKRLNLTDQQAREIRPILRTHMSQLEKIKREARPKIAEELTQMNGKVIALLNDKQKRMWSQDFRKLRQQFQLDFTRNRPRTNKDTTQTPSKPSNKNTPAHKTKNQKQRKTNQPGQGSSGSDNNGTKQKSGPSDQKPDTKPESNTTNP